MTGADFLLCCVHRVCPTPPGCAAPVVEDEYRYVKSCYLLFDDNTLVADDAAGPGKGNASKSFPGLHVSRKLSSGAHSGSCMHVPSTATFIVPHTCASDYICKSVLLS